MAVYLCHEFPDLYEHGDDHRRGGPRRPRSVGVPSGWRWAGQRHRLARSRRRHRGRDGRRSRRRRVVLARRCPRAVRACRADSTGGAGGAAAHRLARPHALVYESFPGTLGAQINDDGTGRMDFDLSEVDNDVLRALDGGVNDVIRERGRGAQRLRRRRRRGDRRRPRPQPVGCPSADARWNAAGDRHRRRRPPGLRRDPPRTPPSLGRSASRRSRTRASSRRIRFTLE